MFQFSSIDHIAIIGTDYQKSIHFYHDVLGFEVFHDVTRSDKHDRMIQLEKNDTVLELFIKSDAPDRPSFPEASGLRHLAFHVSNIDSVVEYLKQHQIRVEPIRYDTENHQKMTFFYDPDKLPIELHE